MNIKETIDNVESLCVGVTNDLRYVSNIIEGRALVREIVRRVNDGDNSAEAIIIERKKSKDYIDIEIGRKGTRGRYAFYADDFYCAARIFFFPGLYLEYSKPRRLSAWIIETFKSVFSDETKGE